MKRVFTIALCLILVLAVTSVFSFESLAEPPPMAEVTELLTAPVQGMPAVIDNDYTEIIAGARTGVVAGFEAATETMAEAPISLVLLPALIGAAVVFGWVGLYDNDESVDTGSDKEVIAAVRGGLPRFS